MTKEALLENDLTDEYSYLNAACICLCCGHPIPDDAPNGVCPQCVIRSESE